LLDIVDENQNTLVHLATENENVEIFKLFINLSENSKWFSLKNKDQLLPVHIAALKGNLHILKKMEASGVNLSE
jgi:ankyrin repeat protein